ncbi:hypothetical protein JTE90_000647 [Oedothorax gibbosus]|uniref:Prolyl 4-hydroxylase alpha subunit domain-containing protein n=1 Tax=Oedothorax gibbosus TaxID=931172 RepID=A0AAV6VYF4_9ARAC|nr:hypothetical protein JTE90_000647 [Oedothorax gibbosus]
MRSCYTRHGNSSVISCTEHETFGCKNPIRNYISNMENSNKRSNDEDDTITIKRKKNDASSIVNINETYTQDSFVESLSKCFVEKEQSKFESGAKIINEPFTCCVLPNFLQPDEFIQELKNELDEVDVELKLSDLYQFKQSQDLATSTLPCISKFKKLLYGKCLEWMKKVTKIELTEKVDISCSCYTFTDHLLCHDDELEGRRIAYIYYLVPEWEEKDGGTLDLFNTVKGEPSEICTSLVPAWNNLIFFEVSPVSFHQVSEVLAYKTRTSISGWFYGPPLKPNTHTIEKIEFMPPTTIPVDIKQWINPQYLEAETQLTIRDSFEETSEIELADFLQKEKYEEICQALSENSEWKRIGPVSQRNYEEIPDSPFIAPIIKECQALFTSEPFLLIASNLTGLRLHPASAEHSDAKMGEVSSSLRSWKQGSYTLLNDQSFLNFAVLNATLCFNCPDWEVEYGGYTSYVVKEEKEELLRVDPKPNSLALVYITEETTNFVKYINCLPNEHCNKPCFQDIISVYKEVE